MYLFPNRELSILLTHVVFLRYTRVQLQIISKQTNVCTNKCRHFWQRIKIKNNGECRSCKKFLINSKIDEEDSSPNMDMLAGLGSKKDSFVGTSIVGHKHGGGQFSCCRQDLVKPIFKTLSFIKDNVLQYKSKITWSLLISLTEKLFNYKLARIESQIILKAPQNFGNRTKHGKTLQSKR
jgi:hypothetical protein